MRCPRGSPRLTSRPLRTTNGLRSRALVSAAGTSACQPVRSLPLNRLCAWPWVVAAQTARITNGVMKPPRGKASPVPSNTVLISVNTTRYGLVASGVMLGALEGQERVNGRYGHRVSGPNANLGTARTLGRLIGDLGAASRHGGCTRDYLGVHPERLGKISGPKCHRNVAHVLPDRDDPSD